MSELREVLVKAIDGLNSDWGIEALKAIGDDTDIMSVIDSFAAVEILLATEDAVQRYCGRYVPLGSEAMTDADKSPLRRMASWQAYVESAIAASDRR